jgi:hypothetical protein
MGIHDNRYVGLACVGRVFVYSNNEKKPLKSRPDLKNFCEGTIDSFDWGCATPECYQLGVAILANEYGDEFAIKHCKEFTESNICTLNEEKNWAIDSDDLDKFTFKIAAA